MKKKPTKEEQDKENLQSKQSQEQIQLLKV